jgi:probable LLM family oxidoreductase
VIRNVIDEGVRADACGVDCFGAGEHHRDDFALTAPEVALAAIAGRTERIRLGSAVTVLSTDDPVRVFQRFSTLNAITGGRAEAIVGRGAFTESFPLFGYELSQYGPLFDEKLELFAELLRRPHVTWSGKMRAPLCDHRVYPPLEAHGLKCWVAVGSTPGSVERAARYGMPLMLGIIGGDAQRFVPFVQTYRSAFAERGGAVPPIGVHSPGHVAETDEQAREEYWAAYKVHRDRVGRERGWPPLTRSKFETEVERGALYVGAAATVARRIVGTIKLLGLSRFDLKYSTGPLPHPRLLRSIELFGREVMPRVRAALCA